MRRAQHGSWYLQWQFFVLGLVTIYEGLVVVLSLGFLDTQARADLLFSEWFGYYDNAGVERIFKHEDKGKNK